MAFIGPRLVWVSFRVSIRNKHARIQLDLGHLFTMHQPATLCWVIWSFLCLLVKVLAGSHHQRIPYVLLPWQSGTEEELQLFPWWMPSNHFHFPLRREVLQLNIQTLYTQNSTYQLLLCKEFQALSQELDKTLIRYRWRIFPFQSNYYHNQLIWSMTC